MLSAEWYWALVSTTLLIGNWGKPEGSKLRYCLSVMAMSQLTSDGLLAVQGTSSGEWQRNVSKRPPCRRTRDWGWLRPWPQRIEDRQQKSLRCKRPWQQRRHPEMQTKMRPAHPAWAATRTVRISNQVPYKALGKEDLSVVAAIPGQSSYKSRQWFQKAH